MHLALVGTTNSGKTSLFNALTGSRQKVANYPGVTVERNEGSFVTPLGRQVSLVDPPGTYSLRGRSPDEEITRDLVLGRTASEALPDLVLSVADSTNLRLTIRLLLELKSTGRPLILVLNMFDIATHRGVTVDVPRLSETLGVPVVTSIAARNGGTAELLRRTDELIAAQAPRPAQPNLWQPLTVAQLRATQRDVAGIYTRAKMFLQRAGTTIFSMMVLIWFLASFPQPPDGTTEPAINYSLAAMIGKVLEPFLAPVGFNWQIAVALIPGMAAREVAVAALGTVYAIEGGKEAAEQIGQVLATKWSLATALSLLAWFIFAPQCASTLAVIRRETGSWTWMWVTFGYMFALAYAASFATCNIAVALRAR